MAWIVADSFDYYSTAADIARSVWDSATVGSLAFNSGANTRFGTGQLLTATAGAAVYFTKTMASNEATLYVVFAFYRATALSGTNPEFYFQFRDGATNQCTIVMESSGNIVLKRGDHTGTVVATYSAAFAQDVWCHFQCRVVIDPSAGTFTVRKNGQVGDTFSATGLNTRSSANSYANVVAVGNGTVSVNTRLDDLLFFSGSGAAPNTWVGDVRAICLSPQADTAQKQFTAFLTPATSGTNAAVTQNFANANTLYCSPFVATRSGQLQKVTVNCNAAYTGNMQAALYAADGSLGAPGTLLATSAAITNPAAGAVNDLTFTGGPWIAQGVTYHMALLHNLSGSPQVMMQTAMAGYSTARTYASGFPNPAGTMTSGVTYTPYHIITHGGNVTQVSEALANGDTDYVYDSTVNDADLYDMADVPVTPFAIIGVVAKIYAKKSDAGTRQGQILFKSGGTQVAGVDTLLSTTYTYLSLVQAADPATGTTWTLAGVNACQVGQKVTV